MAMNTTHNTCGYVHNRRVSLVSLNAMRSKAPDRCPDCGNDVGSHLTARGVYILLEFGAWPDGNVIIEGGVAVVLGRNDPRRFDGRILLMPHKARCVKARAKQPA